MAEASKIANLILEKRISTKGGVPSWIGPTGYRTDLSPLTLVQLGPYLYGGTSGIGLFLAALEAVLGHTGEFRAASLEAISPIRRKLSALSRDPERAERVDFPLGGLIGIGSLVYSLVKIGELLGLEELKQEALEATVLIRHGRIHRDQRVRIQTGCAGTILSLLALHGVTPRSNANGETALDLARICASHIIETQTAFEDCPKAWPLSPGKPPLAGFSYGAAGIAFAMMRLYALTSDRDFLVSAEEGWRFVNHLYCPGHGNWKDMRPIFQRSYRPKRGTWKDWWAYGAISDLEPNEDKDAQIQENHFLETWCHGSCGIALGLLEDLGFMDSKIVRQQIHEVLSRLKAYCRGEELPEGRADDLCCGHMGLIEFLLQAYKRLGDGTALIAAQTLMTRLLRRAHAKGRYELSAARGTDVFTPYLFQGLAGVGYTLLRLANPHSSIPCILILE